MLNAECSSILRGTLGAPAMAGRVEVTGRYLLLGERGPSFVEEVPPPTDGPTARVILPAKRKMTRPYGTQIISDLAQIKICLAIGSRLTVDSPAKLDLSRKYSVDTAGSTAMTDGVLDVLDITLFLPESR